jgi:SNF2 family DNA or RNA helicase
MRFHHHGASRMNDAPILPQALHRFAGLYQHQAVELQHLLGTTGHRLLYWEQGVGKTPVAARLGQAIGDAPKLYLAPASCKAQVARELVRWGCAPRVQVLEGRRAKLDPAASWAVVNYDLLLAPQLLEQLLAQRWALGVLDEAHLLRHATAKRTEHVFGRTPCLAEQLDRVLLLTGTPVVNSPADLFPAVNRLIPRAIAVTDASGALRRMQRHEFEARYCVYRTARISGGRTLQVPAGAQNTAELRARLLPFMSRLRRGDVLDLPALKLQEFALSVTVTKELTAALAQVPTGLLRQLQTAKDDELLALLQRYAAQLSTLRRVLGVAKANAAADRLVERLAGGEDRVIGFFHHRETVNTMLTQLAAAEVTVGAISGDTPVVQRQELIDAFDRGELPVLLLQSQSGSLGLNLQSCRYAAIVEPDWTAAVTEQAVARLYRAGQTRDVTVDFLMLPGTLDEHVVQVARRKAQVAAALIEAQAA